MGPFELIDLIGLDVNLAVTKSVWAAYFHDPRYAPSILQQERVAAGFLGRKAGRGFYDYTPGAAKPVPSTEAAQPAPARVTVHGDLGHRGAARRADRRAVASRSNAREPIRAFPRERSTYRAARAAFGSPSPTGARQRCASPIAACASSCSSTSRSTTRWRRDWRVARADTCGEAAYAMAAGTLQAAGLAVSRLDDVAGLAVLRIVAMLANEAADAVVQGVALPEAIDIAMQKGVNYPRGPLAWARCAGRGIGSRRARSISPRITARTVTASRRWSRAGPRPEAGFVGEHHPAMDAGGRPCAGRRVAAAMYARDAATQALGIRVAQVGPGHAELSMAVRADMLNGHAICHGGFIFALADSAFAYACNSYNLNTVASGCAIDFIAPAREGDVLTAKAHERQLAGRTGVYDVEVVNQRGESVALFRGKSYRIKGHLIDGLVGGRDARQTRRLPASSSPSRPRAATTSPRCSSNGCNGRSRTPTSTCRTIGASSTPPGVHPQRPQVARRPREISVHDQGGPARQLSVRNVRRAARADRRASTRRREPRASRRSSATRPRTSTRGPP